MKTYLRIIVFAIFIFTAQATVAQTDVIIAIDLSKSMRQNDPKGNRFIGADQFLTMFSLYGDNRGGVVSFGNGTSIKIPLGHLSFDQANKYKSVLDQLQDEDWTELGLGLKTSRQVLGQSSRKKSIILISDGIVEGNPQTRGISESEAKAQAEAELWREIIPGLASINISVYTVGLFSATDAGEAVLQKIAADTGGFYSHVRRPEEFSQVYKKMLDDIGQPAGVSELTSEKNSIVLTPADEGVIVFGPTRFTAKAPNNVTYTTNRETPNTPVKQKFVEYSDDTGILYLGRPDNIDQNDEFWSGRWQVEGLSGPGEATYISNVRLNQSAGLPVRRTFFLNELYPLEYRFETRPGLDAETFLSNCRIEYLLVPQDNSGARPISGKVTRNGNIFTGEQLLEREGDYLLQVRVFYHNVERSPPPVRISVSNMQLIEMTDPQDGVTQGESFRIRVKENPAAFKNDSLIKGLADSAMTFRLHYGSDKPISLDNKVILDQNGVFNSENLQYAKAGDLEVEGFLEGKLVAQKPMQNGDPVISHYKVRARTSKKVSVGQNFMSLIFWTGSGFVTFIGIVGSLFSIYAVVFQKPKYERLDRAALTGRHTIRLEPEKKTWKRLLRPHGAAVSIGGPESSADITDPELKNGGPAPVMEIGIDSDGNYNIVRTGILEVCLNKVPLETNRQKMLSPRDEISVNDMHFQFMD